MQNEGLKDDHIRERLKKGISWLKEMTGTLFRSRNGNLAYYITIAPSLIIFIVGIALFIELTDELAENQLTDFDKDISTFIQSYRTDTLTNAARFITELGDRYTYVTVILASGIFLWMRFSNWRFTLRIVGVLVISTISNVIVKRIVDRARPDADHLVFVDTLSYPSGHSMSAMAFYGTLIYLCLNSRMHIFFRIIFAALCGTIIIAVGASRIYLGVHYPSDVLGGFIGGLICVTLSIILLNTIDLWRIHRVKSAHLRL